MKLDRKTTVLAAALAFAAALPLATTMITPAQAASVHHGPSPFCLLPGSSNGPGGAPQICGYYDYQQCLQAAADMNANCVANIDFPGQIVRTPNGWRGQY